MKDKVAPKFILFPICLALLALLPAIPSSGGDSEIGEEKMEWLDAVHPRFFSLIQWDSRYASEGRDNLDGASIYSLQVSSKLGPWLLGAWLASGDDANYEERNFTIERGFEFLGCTGFIGYNHLQFPTDGNSHDNEVGTGLSGPLLPGGIAPEIHAYYSFVAGGTYLEFGFSRDIALSDRVSLAVPIMAGSNYGYISDGHRELDHVRISLELSCQISKNTSLEAHFGHSFAIHASPGTFPDDASLKDFFHGGIGLAITF